MATYPGAIADLDQAVDDVTEVDAAIFNPLIEEIEAIETELGIDVAGSQTDLVTRLANCMTAAGYAKLGPGDTKTISSGAITVTGNFHKIDTEGAAASDDLITINGYGANQFLRLMTVNASRDVTIKHGTGNIYCAGEADIVLSTNYEVAELIYDTTNSRWVAAKCPAGSVTGGGIIATGGNNLTVSPVALTAALTQITHAEPGTPDYAIQDLTNSSPYGFASQDEGNSVLKVILNLQTRVDELEAALQTEGLIS